MYTRKENKEQKELDDMTYAEKYGSRRELKLQKIYGDIKIAPLYNAEAGRMWWEISCHSKSEEIVAIRVWERDRSISEMIAYAEKVVERTLCI